MVWQVLNALRAHDDRFNAIVNSIALNTPTSGGMRGQGRRRSSAHIGPTTTPNPASTGGETETTEPGDGVDPYATDPAAADRELAKQMALFSLSEWQEAIYARIVTKVGTRTYWEDWAHDVADIAAALISRIRAVLADADQTIADWPDRFVTGLRDNPTIPSATTTRSACSRST
ncbi:hypothetical protein GCM10023353_39050 [Tomitella cavernea]|uniref:Type ISP restriction-modification enzyme coupler domain-containing protein n=1 Tax=Tomitella cavernea TaxID=1387982 RepID=A0ABP9D3G8_9ACTN